MIAHGNLIRCTKCAGSLALITCAACSALAIYSYGARKTEGPEVAWNAALLATAKGKVAVFLAAKSSRRDHIIVEAEVTNNTDAQIGRASCRERV